MPAARRAYHHGSLREAMIEAAVDILEETGAETVSVREAARRAGVSSGAPFRHFASKTALMTAVAEDGMQRLRAAIGQSVRRCKSDHPLVRLIAIADGYVHWATTSPTHYRVVGDRTQIDFDASEILTGGAGAIRQDMTRIFEEAKHLKLLRTNDIDALHFECRAFAYGLARMCVDGHLPEWGVPKSKAAAAMRAAFRRYALSLAADPAAMARALEA